MWTATEKQKAQEAVARKKAKGICIATGCHVAARSGRTMCEAHLTAMSRYAKERRVKRQAEGLCVDCGRPSELGQARCLLCSSDSRQGLPQPIRHALSEYRKFQQLLQRDAACRTKRKFVERNLYLIRSERTRQILMMRYGATEAECLTLEEIGARFEITRERVRQIQLRAEERIAMFTIEKDIPIPSGLRGKAKEIRETLMAMEVGDSFLVPATSSNSGMNEIAKALGYMITSRKASETERRVWLVSKNGTQATDTAASAGTTE